ncbi:MAG: (d)CMP kinase [Candidatus Levybacteria bacterium]|nr:(d)CMP kinase [Candidatus Levybacteria bacterium]
MENKNFIIAIDGPVGSGKGTLAVALAKKLNALYVYTGGMYRALALKCLRANINLENEEAVLQILNNTKIELGPTEYTTKVILDEEDVSSEIFSPKVGKVVPIVAAHKKVRKEMVQRQKKLINQGNIVIEGRDISTDVSPEADIKIYLTADLETRAKRRQAQYKKRGIDMSLGEIINEVEERDSKDMERTASPLTVTEDALVIDTTNDTIEQTVNKVMEKLREKGI